MSEPTPTIKERFENITEQATNLVETGYKLAVIQVTEKISTAAGNIVVVLLLILTTFFFFFFLFFGIAYWIGDALHDLKLGFFITSGFYLLLIVLLIALRKSVVIPLFRNFIIQKMHEDED